MKKAEKGRVPWTINQTQGYIHEERERRYHPLFYFIDGALGKAYICRDQHKVQIK